MMSRNVLWLAACTALLAGSAASAVPILVDLETSSSTTYPGYTRVLQTNRFDQASPGPVTLADGVQVGWKDYCSASGTNRTSFSQMPNPGALFADFNAFGSGIVETLQVKNLAAGLYDLTLFAADPAYKDKVTQFDVDQDNDGTFDTQVVIDWKNLSETNKTVQVNVSAAGVLSMTVQRYGTSAGGCFNGFSLVAVPEPVTLAVLALGAALFIRRRR